MTETKPVPDGIVRRLGGPVELVAREAIKWQLIDWDRHDVGREKTPNRRMLEDFITLWRREKASAVAAFAERWGPLRVDTQCQPVTAAFGTEPLKQWWFLSRRAYSVLDLSKSLESGTDGAEDSWSVLCSQHHGVSHDNTAHGFYGFPDWGRWEYYDDFTRKIQFSGYRSAREQAKAIVAWEISRWLSLFPVTLGMKWDKRISWQIATNYDGGRFLSAIALQLALHVANADTLFNCSGCGWLYIRSGRKPNKGQRNFCKECVSAGRPQEIADREYRENCREAKQLYAKGLSPLEIANRLSRTVPVVKRWIGLR